MSSTDSPEPMLTALLREGQQHHAAGRLREAQDAYRRALAIDPGHPETLAVSGILAGQAGQFDTAVALLSRALKRDPRNAQIHHNLGETYRQLEDFSNAQTSLRRAIELNRDHYDAYQSLAELLLSESARQQAAGHAAAAHELRLAAARQLSTVGTRLLQKKSHAAAAEKFRVALELDPNNAAIWRGLAHALHLQPSKAVAALERAIALAPQHVWAYGQLGNALVTLGRLADAEKIYNQGLSIGPDDLICRQGMVWLTLVLSLYWPETTAAQIFDSHRRWGEAAVAAQAAVTIPSFANSRDPDRRLRVGYVSPDLKLHSVAYFFEPLLAAHDPVAVETFCYSGVEPNDEDAVTARLKGLAHHWFSTVGIDDQALRRQIRKDRIDILIDLTGHFALNRLPSFVAKPAPVTASWLGYPATTGLPNMDWRITDAIADPPGAEDFHTEKLMRLPEGFLCYRPPEGVPELAPLPALTKGYVTFGSFNNNLKLNGSVARSWAALLRAVPRSRLLLKSAMGTDPAVQERQIDMLRTAGADPSRIDSIAWQNETDRHFGAYAAMDVALDPFPYNGTTTTCEALWMGVPVVALIGDRHASRVGFDLLTRVGLPELAAPDAESYVRRAAELVKDLPALSSLRQGLRERMRRSPLCDAARFGRDFDAALRQMWRQYCAGAA
jgi:predicted O-linked N-acetylglucosamine transferase (SPINDLY family)